MQFIYHTQENEVWYNIPLQYPVHMQTVLPGSHNGFQNGLAQYPGPNQVLGALPLAVLSC